MFLRHTIDVIIYILQTLNHKDIFIGIKITFCTLKRPWPLSPDVSLLVLDNNKIHQLMSDITIVMRVCQYNMFFFVKHDLIILIISTVYTIIVVN